jgi:hypothetical protein
MNNWLIQEASLLITGNVYADIIIVLGILLILDLIVQEF